MQNRIDVSRIGAAEALSMERFRDEALYSGDFVSALDNAVKRGCEPDATAFERYAAKLLREAGYSKLARAIRTGAAYRIHPPDNGKLAIIEKPARASDSLDAVLLPVECALNRLICISDAISDGDVEGSPQNREPRRSISILGGAFLSPDGGWRSSLVKLPSLDSPADVTPEYYNEVDWRSTDNVASNSRAVFQRCVRPNSYRTVSDLRVGAHSDWDVRTRLGQILGCLELPHRYSFRFDYDDNTKTVSALFTCPPPHFLPAILGTGEDFENRTARARAYSAYILRLACLFSAACFGSGTKIGTTVIAGFDSSWEHPLVSARFDRIHFSDSVLSAIDTGELSRPDLRFEPERISRYMDASQLDWIGRREFGATQTISLPILDLRRDRSTSWTSDRCLSPETQRLFRSCRPCDIDTVHYYGPHADGVDLARDDAAESPLSSIIRLESLVDELERQLQPPDGLEGSRPLFADNPFSRLAVSLLDDELTIADQAEAFLHENGDACAVPKAPLYYRAPSALFHARFGLSNLYQIIGDFPAAELQANRCIALAPTTTKAYFRKADVLAEQGKLSEAANVLLTSLRVASLIDESAFLYYHLGMLLWNMERYDEAVYVHVFNTSLKSESSRKSSQVIEGLKQQGTTLPGINLTAYDASHELLRFGYPLAPMNMRHEISQAAVLLANDGCLDLAAPYACKYERFSSDEIVKAACRSIRFGSGIVS